MEAARRAGLRSGAALFLIAASLTSFGGCTSTVGKTGLETLDTPPSVERLAGELVVRRQALATFRGQARLEYQGVRENDRLKTTQMILAHAPRRLRIDVMNPFGVSYSFATDGERITAFDRGEETYYEGVANRVNFTRFTGVPIDLDVLMALVRGLPPLDGRGIGEGLGGEVEADEDGWQWMRRMSDGGRMTTWFGGDFMDPKRFEIRDSAELGSFEVRFGRYHRVDGVRVAHEVRVAFADGSSLELDYSSVWRAEPSGLAVFQIKRPASARFVDVDKEVPGQ